MQLASAQARSSNCSTQGQLDAAADSAIDSAARASSAVGAAASDLNRQARTTGRTVRCCLDLFKMLSQIRDRINELKAEKIDQTAKNSEKSKENDDIIRNFQIEDRSKEQPKSK